MARIPIKFSATKSNFDARSIITQKIQEKKCRILIDNLERSVTESDLSELFNSVGPVKNVSLRLKKEGSSTGSGEVIFVRHSDATRAVNKFNNVLLDGRQMKISLVGEKQERLENNKERKPTVFDRISCRDRETFRQPLRTKDARVFRNTNETFRQRSANPKQNMVLAIKEHLKW